MRTVFQMVLLACVVHIVLHGVFLSGSNRSAQTDRVATTLMNLPNGADLYNLGSSDLGHGMHQQLLQQRISSVQAKRTASSMTDGVSTIQMDRLQYQQQQQQQQRQQLQGVPALMTPPNEQTGQRSVLVLGALNFVGRTLVEMLLARGDRVIVVVSKYQTEEQSQHAVFLEEIAQRTPSLSFRQSTAYNSFTSQQAAFSQYRPQIVCQTQLFDEESGHEEIGISKSLANTLQLSVDYGVKNVVLVSAVASAPLEDTTAFDTRRKHLEMLGEAYHDRYGINVMALRFSHVYGPAGPTRRLPVTLLDVLVRQRTFGELQEHAGVYFDFVYLADAVRAIVQAADRPLGWNVIDVASGTVTTFPELVQTAEAVTGQTVSPRPIRLDTYGASPSIDVSKTRTVLSFEASTTLQEGLTQTLAWYRMLDSSKPLQEYPPLPSDGTRNHAEFHAHKKICFFHSVFGSSVEEVDVIPHASRAPESIARNSTSFSFLLFTNLEDLRVPGWKTVVLNLDLPNNILKSRFPKFMAWQIPAVIEDCKVVFYSDGGWLPIRTAPVWEKLAARTIAHEAGLIQMKHTRTSGILDELGRIVKYQKDSEEKVSAERDWYLEQPDFVGNATMYCNMCFGFDPHNPRYREMSTFFWNRYKSGIGSWRDQPLWCYSLAHFKIQPAHLGFWPSDIRSPERQKWKMLGAVGFNGHKYIDKKKP